MAQASNTGIAARLDEVAGLLDEPEANRFRIAAYRKAADTIRGLDRPVAEIVRTEGLEGLDRLPGIGPSIARAVRDLVTLGQLPMLERLRGGHDPVLLLRTVPGIGLTLAERLHQDLDIDSLTELESAAYDGRLAAVEGIGRKKLENIRHHLASRLGRVKSWPAPAGAASEPSVAELLSVDREYRAKAGAGSLRLIAPRRFNPTGEAWLPVLHTNRCGRHYTALFSNTARAHQLSRTRDWVVLYYEGDHGEGQCTVVTEHQGPLKNHRVVRGREAECLQLIHPPLTGISGAR